MMISNEELVVKARKGDIQAYNELFRRNDGFNFYMANRFGNVAESDDLVSLSRIGMVKAYKTYDIKSGVKFITYAYNVIRNEILMYNRKILRSKSEIYLDTPLSVDSEGNELTYLSILESDFREGPEYQYEQKEELKSMYRAIEGLDPRDRCIIVSIYLRGKTQREVAKMLNLSQSYISRIERRTLLKLRKDIEKVNIYKEGGKEKMSRPYNAFSEETVGKLCYIFDLIKNGDIKITLKDIGKLLDISASSVRNYNGKYELGELDDIKRVRVDIDSKYYLRNKPMEKITEKIKVEEPQENKPVEEKEEKEDKTPPGYINISGTDMKVLDIAEVMGSIFTILGNKEVYDFSFVVTKKEDK